MKTTDKAAMRPLELWGGIECTVNRVGEEFFDQFDQSGHPSRLSDLDLVARLGIRTMRYPIVWERTYRDGAAEADWSYPDAAMKKLDELDIEPIVGLVHHGSGPRHTNLLDPEFPEKTAQYAAEVARRYPHLEKYTPVNEPLTTARFSALYGHWYPHATDGKAFMQALIYQCKAVALSMRAIREVNPLAELVQTEDMGRTYSTRKLAYQADFENERRWLSFDLLCGRVDRDHPMWGFLKHVGIDSREVMWFADNPCPPDILGINHYLTSERFLDERLDRYPAHTHGGNGRHQYADVEAVRVRAEGIGGPKQILKETWDRYGMPIAVTEAHLGCTRDEQMRWLVEVWDAAKTLRKQGADIRAVTVWSMFGAYDWCSLLTKWCGSYEAGVFEIREGKPRRTVLARLVQNLAQGCVPNYEFLRSPGWWARDDRLEYPPVSAPVALEAPRERAYAL